MKPLVLSLPIVLALTPSFFVAYSPWLVWPLVALLLPFVFWLWWEISRPFSAAASSHKSPSKER